MVKSDNLAGALILPKASLHFENHFGEHALQTLDSYPGEEGVQRLSARSVKIMIYGEEMGSCTTSVRLLVIRLLWVQKR